MQIGQVIKKYRKIKGLTQVEMANRLGVTAPAVNKWENGNSYPDITLLAPIARLLDISLDTLLAFKDNLTGQEINDIVREAENILKEKPYGDAIKWAKEKIAQYPNCLALIWYIAIMFDGWRLAKNVFEEQYHSEENKDTSIKCRSEDYDDIINGWYERALCSEDEDVREKAADSLFSACIRKEQYDKAEEYLAYFSTQNPERKRKQAVLYSKTNKTLEAYKEYEELIFSQYQRLVMLLQNLYTHSVEDNNMEKAEMIVEKQCRLAELFEMGAYREGMHKLDLAMVKKDADATIDAMKKILSGVDSIYDFRKSKLYEHMDFKEVNKEFIEETRRNLKIAFSDQEALDYLKDDSRYMELIS